MVKAVTTVEIARPIEEVFSFLSDTANADQWMIGLVEVRHDGPIRLGATGADIRTMGGREVEMPWTVTAFDPPHKAVFEYTQPFEIRAEFTFEAIDGGTRVRCESDIKPTGRWRLMAPLLAREARKEDRAQFDKAKRILERDAADPAASTGSDTNG